ncbi:M48 family metalloprotease [Microbacterium sp. Mu-80]|uniref:M48 family metalloprotease n=1 Tax=Microbacterium bandirmense TaxID=3122050 RepID=A0ABU8LG14_9MICO
MLTVGHWPVRHPRIALTLWFGAFFGGGILVLGAVITTIAAALNAGAAPTVAEAIMVTLAAWVSVGAIGAVVAFVGVSAEPLAHSYRRSLARLAPVAVARQERRGFTLVWFDSPSPVACAVPGRPAEILVSTAMRDLLSAPQLQAVIAHEYAHLRLRHGWAMRIAELNALCLPGALRAGQGLKRATSLLIELVADDAAARQAGAAHLANALTRLAAATDDPGLAVRAERLTLRRWPTAARRRLPEPIRI